MTDPRLLHLPFVYATDTGRRWPFRRLDWWVRCGSCDKAEGPFKKQWQARHVQRVMADVGCPWAIENLSDGLSDIPHGHAEN